MIQIPMTPAEFAEKSAKLSQEQGLAMSGDEGTVSKMGVTAAYKYADGMLSVNVVDKPFFVTEEYCEGELKKIMGAA